ncbi:sialidase family protein [Fuerstiella marisgermanici]|uniref:Neuraminidase (Sialidase) n=1 Tax=Fuerstiella marisgermanici TaxID=1891926 RepID=A0A1P8WMJ9_9PLAN|nr:sialidase family protein [Fuerstiella marisgermanici]APZ95285.1 Neuraminidase (sialidase) [Fuerstiella marisgermanici]
MSLRVRICTLFSVLLWLHVGFAPLAEAAPPVLLLQEPLTNSEPPARRMGYAIMRMPDGTFAFYDRYRPESGPLRMPDRNGRVHSLSPGLPDRVLSDPSIMNSGVLNNPQVILTPDSNVVSMQVRREALTSEQAAEIGLRSYLDVWMQTAGPEGVPEPKMIWRGYNGSQMEYQQLKNGRLLVPFGSMQPHARPEPPTGRHKTVIQYSDDGGATWHESPSKLTAACYANFNGLNEGACEPAIEELSDGRLWMLMRTSAGFLYESFSSDNGTTWTKATASRFHTSTGPPNIMRHSNGWLVVTWNNCEMPPRANGDGVYGGRDALHMAVSDDDGKTWRGFREIYLDHRRNDNPAKSGDRGTAYPLGAFTDDGRIVILAGQGAGGRNAIVIDPEWIEETQAATDFSNGLEDWSVYKHHGPARGWWRARAVGCEVVSSPTDAASRCLHVRKPDELPADGATWNFPNGWTGSLTTRIMLPAGSQGGILSLNDRMFDPSNDYGEQFSVFRLELRSDAILNHAIRPGQWHDVVLKWDLAAAECRVLVDGMPAGTLPLNNATLNGISYVRFRSSATSLDAAGFLVDSVKVQIDTPHAPECSTQDRIQQEQRYVQRVVPTWAIGE